MERKDTRNPSLRMIEERFHHADRLRKARRHIELAIVECEKSDIIDGERKLVV